MRKLLFLLLITSGIVFNACNNDKESNVVFGAEEELILELAPGLSLEQALSITARDGENPALYVTVSVPDYMSTIELEAGTVEEQRLSLIQQIDEELELLIPNFDPEDPLETELHTRLNAIRSELNKSDQLPIQSIQVAYTAVSEDTILHPSVQDFRVVSAEEDIDVVPEEEFEDVEMDVSFRTNFPSYMDFPNDAAYNPISGTSQILQRETKDGGRYALSLQKFVLDEEAVSKLRGENGDIGIEIDTLVIFRDEAIKAKDHIECGKRWGANANLKEEKAGRYRDTEFLDGTFSFLGGIPPDRVACAVGILKANELEANTQYAVWRRFKKFDVENKETIIQVLWEPTHTCELGDVPLILVPAFPILKWKCGNGEKALCKCQWEGMKYQGLVQYVHNDAPYEEVEWCKNPEGESGCKLPDACFDNTCLATVQSIPTDPGYDYVQGDFTADGNVDILWRRPDTGELSLWEMNGINYVQSLSLIPSDLNWMIAGVADFTGDNVTDILWRRPDTGELSVWKMSGITPVQSLSLIFSDPSWIIAGVADFTGDDVTDILWRQPGTGDLSVWEMNGVNVIQSLGLIPSDPNWGIVGVADFTGDGVTDILWRHPDTGELSLWEMSGVSYVQSLSLIPSDPNWRIASVADFTGDDVTDILWRNPSTGQLSVWEMDGVTHLRFYELLTSIPVWQIVPNFDVKKRKDDPSNN